MNRSDGSGTGDSAAGPGKKSPEEPGSGEKAIAASGSAKKPAEAPDQAKKPAEALCSEEKAEEPGQGEKTAAAPGPGKNPAEAPCSGKKPAETPGSEGKTSAAPGQEKRAKAASRSRSRETLERFIKFKYMVIPEGALVGVLAGIVVSLLRLSIMKMEALNEALREACRNSPSARAVFVLFIAAAFLITLISLKLVPLASGSGIPQVKGELIGRVFLPWAKIIPAKLVGTAVCLGAGLSMGNEGPSVQLGAMTGKGFSRLTKRVATEEKILITVGAGAGLSCAFNAPLAGVLFALEDIRGALSPDIMAAAMAGAITSNLVSYYIFGLGPVLSIKAPGSLPIRYYWLIILLGAVLGVFGVFFNRFTDLMKDLFEKIPSETVRLAIPFLLVFPVSVFMPRVLGTGYSLITDAGAGKFVLSALIATLVVKFIYSMICTNSGVPGGIFLPLLVIGALTGAIWFDLTAQGAGVPDGYLTNFVIYGMTGFFAAVIRAPLTGVILITELTGNFTNFLSLTVVALIATVTAELLHGEPVYDQMLARLIRGQNGTSKEEVSMNESAHKKVLLESDVFMECEMDGRTIAEFDLPKGCLVISVVHEGEDIVPGGGTVLKGGDKLALICNFEDEYRVERILAEKLRTPDEPGTHSS